VNMSTSGPASSIKGFSFIVQLPARGATFALDRLFDHTRGPSG
jgi:hypothetical protein